MKKLDKKERLECYSSCYKSSTIDLIKKLAKEGKYKSSGAFIREAVETKINRILRAKERNKA